MSDTLDLDALLPEPFKVKINGRIIEVMQPSLRQLLSLQKVFINLQSALKESDADIDVIQKQLMDAVSDIVPAMKEDAEIDLTIEQLIALMNFIQEKSTPQNVAQTSYSSQKKTE